MPKYRRPDVYVEEITSQVKPIKAISTSTVAFVGEAYRGPENIPTRIHSWHEYIRYFGEYSRSSGVSSEKDEMALAVWAFYQNGGKAAYICRVMEDTAFHSPLAGSVVLQNGNTDVLEVKATSKGCWSNLLRIAVAHDDELFELHLGMESSGHDFIPLSKEIFRKLSMNPAKENFVERVVNESSALVEVRVLNRAALPPNQDTIGTSRFSTFSALANGAQSVPSAKVYRSFYEQVLHKYSDVSIIVLPGQQWPADGTRNEIIASTIEYCDTRMASMVIIDPPADTELNTPDEVQRLNLPESDYSALYYPWVTVANPCYHSEENPAASKKVVIPPAAVAAAIWGKVDSSQGVWKAPAGVETALRVSGLQYLVGKQAQSALNARGINCLRDLSGYGPVIWGSRTLASSTEIEWRYLPVRRTAIFIEQSIYSGTQWAVFEQNDVPLWRSLRECITSFMDGLFRAGAFQGSSIDDVYFVECGLAKTMTQTDVDRGLVIIQVGFAPLKPAEFLVLRIKLKLKRQ